MRGSDDRSLGMFSYVRLEDRIAADHPLRAIRALVEEVLERLSGRLAGLYSHTGRPSIPPEQLLKTTLLQAFFSVRSERQLMEQIDYNLLFRWFVGLEMAGKPIPSPKPNGTNPPNSRAFQQPAKAVSVHSGS